MVSTSLALVENGHSQHAAGDVISWHVVAMFAPSFFTGFLIRRFGAHLVAIAGFGILSAAAMFAANGLSFPHFYGSLILLGIGWNFGFVSATSMLANSVSEDEKFVVQGANDTAMGLASVAGAFIAGFILSGSGWTYLATGALIVLVPTLVLLIADRRSFTE